MLTTKEAVLIGDLMNYEQLACKKARLYSRIFSDANLASQFNSLADAHEQRYLALVESV